MVKYGELRARLLREGKRLIGTMARKATKEITKRVRTEKEKHTQDAKKGRQEIQTWARKKKKELQHRILKPAKGKEQKSQFIEAFDKKLQFCG